MVSLQDHGRRIDFQVSRTWRKLRKVTPPQIPRSYFFGPIFNGNHQSDQPAAGVAFGSLLIGPRRMRNFVNDININREMLRPGIATERFPKHVPDSLAVTHLKF
ncbi:uncharacterized protein LOC129750685 isoform X2 [Uranotaenia lowii]|uniref:uncharacterized protein LOC129750685 isoform X2 n=1 Tax=Uranotaenia lowii TaxID=190385 RepID=UPI002479C879|nr:uncharacterized protein LOC129750685 isoform X2 [Uranotaenia lowii]